MQKDRSLLVDHSTNERWNMLFLSLVLVEGKYVPELVVTIFLSELSVTIR